MAGNTSTTSIIEVDGKKVFTKLKRAEEFDLRTFSFQNMLYLTFDSELRINKPLYIQNSISGYISARYECIDEKPWDINNGTISLFGKYLAELHNFCYQNKDKIKLKIKEFGTSIHIWDLVEDCAEKQEAFDIRLDIYKTLQPYNYNQISIPLHRDFKLQNILSDGEKFFLIDFDFAAIDNIGIEIMSFIMDLFSKTLQKDLIDSFISEYKKHSNIPIDWSTMVNDYLVYMCCNTFPFYMRKEIGELNFKELLEDRNSKLKLANILKEKLHESLQR